MAKWVNSIKHKAESHPLAFGVILALLFSIGLSIPYLIQTGEKISTNGQFGDMFSGLPFIIERQYVYNNWRTIFYDWSPFASSPSFLGDSNFFIVPQLIIYSIVSDIAFSYKIYEILLFFTSFLSMYLLAYTISNKKRIVSGVAAAVFYSLTPYLLLELIAHQYMMWAYALLPLAYLLIYKSLAGSKKSKYAWVCLAGILIAASTTYPSIEFSYVNGIFLFLFSIILCFKDVTKNELKLFFNKLISVAIMFSIAIFLSAYFMFPMVFSVSPFSVASVFSRVAQVPVYSNTFIDAAFLLNKGFSVNIGLNYFSIYGLLIIPFMLPILLSSLLILFRRKGMYLLFFILGILAVLFSMGSNLPSFLRIFEYAQKLPLFDMIRTPCRFTIQVALSFSLLGGIAIGLASDSLRKFGSASMKVAKHSYKRVFVVLVIAIILGSYLFSGINITYSVAGPYQNQPMPESAAKVVSWLNQDDPYQNYRIIDLTQTNLIASYHRSLSNGADLISKYGSSPALATLLGLLNVKYIITDYQSDINYEFLCCPYLYTVRVDNDIIFVNTLAKPELYSSYGALAIGGPSVLSTFYTAIDTTVNSAESLNASSQSSVSNPIWALFSPDVLVGQNGLNQVNNFNAVVFEDSDLKDLVFQQLDSSYKFEAWKYLNGDWGIVEDSYGTLIPSAESYQNSVSGQLVLSQRAIKPIVQNATLTIPINVNTTGSYDVWIRASNTLSSETTNIISTSIDGSMVGQVDFGKVGGFQWLKVNNASISLSEGSHTIELFTNGSPVYLDMVAVVPAGLVDSATTEEMATINNLQQMYILEFSNYFVGENVTRENNILPFTSESSSGYLTLKPGTLATQQLFVAKADNYSLNLRFLERPDGGILSLKIDGITVCNIQATGFNIWSWINSSSIYLSVGEHEIEVTSESGNNSIDIMSLIENPLVANLAGEPGDVQYSHVHLNTWQGTLNYTKSAFVVFTESYYPEWVFQMQTKNSNITVPSLEAFYFLNAYPIGSTGVSTFTVYHQTNQMRDISFALSISTFIACILVITTIVMRTRYHKISLKLKRKQSKNVNDFGHL